MRACGPGEYLEVPPPPPRWPPWGGDHASCAKWSETEPKSLFSKGSRPGPQAGFPGNSPPGGAHGDWRHGPSEG